MVVSGPAGAVGQTVGQIAKIKGCRLVGMAGGPANRNWVVKELGFDACLDYKAGPSAVKDGWKQHCPAGVDIHFDNVGGEMLDTVLTRINRGARMEGIVVFDCADRYHLAVAEMAATSRTGA